MYRDYGDWGSPNKLFDAFIEQAGGDGDFNEAELTESGSTSDFGTYLADKSTKRLMWLAERYQRFLSRQNAYGAIVLDSRAPELDNRMRRFFEALQRDGTPYARLDRIVDPLLLGLSHHSIGLQTADLVIASALAGRRVLGDASRWHKQLLPRFARHPDTGALEGVGVVEYPRKAKGEDPPLAKLFTG